MRLEQKIRKAKKSRLRYNELEQRFEFLANIDDVAYNRAHDEVLVRFDNIEPEKRPERDRFTNQVCELHAKNKLVLLQKRVLAAEGHEPAAAQAQAQDQAHVSSETEELRRENERLQKQNAQVMKEAKYFKAQHVRVQDCITYMMRGTPPAQRSNSPAATPSESGLQQPPGVAPAAVAAIMAAVEKMLDGDWEKVAVAGAGEPPDARRIRDVGHETTTPAVSAPASGTADLPLAVGTASVDGGLQLASAPTSTPTTPEQTAGVSDRTATAPAERGASSRLTGVVTARMIAKPSELVNFGPGGAEGKEAAVAKTGPATTTETAKAGTATPQSIAPPAGTLTELPQLTFPDAFPDALEWTKEVVKQAEIDAIRMEEQEKQQQQHAKTTPVTTGATGVEPQTPEMQVLSGSATVVPPLLARQFGVSTGAVGESADVMTDLFAFEDMKQLAPTAYLRKRE